MPLPHYDPSTTALLIVDPYNDFLSEGGKLYPYCKETMDGLGTVANMLAIKDAARAAGIKIAIVPHHQWCEGDFLGWKHMPAVQQGAAVTKSFAKGTWGGEFHDDFQPQPGDLVAQQHWMSSGFNNTDLDMQLRKIFIEKVIIIGLRANTCIETTMRYAAELGYHVTLVKDAIGAFTFEEIRSAVEINGPSYASAIPSTAELIEHLATATKG